MSFKGFISSTLALLAVAQTIVATPATPPDEPMLKAHHYTLEMDSNAQTTDAFFPIGILGASWDQLPYLGMNITEEIRCCYNYPMGKPCREAHQLNPWSGRGKYFMSLWCAHVLYRSRETKNYGKLKNLMHDDGKRASGHHLCYADPQTRAFVMESAKHHAQTSVTYDSPTIGIWGIDNEYELPMDYSPEAIKLFQEWLPHYYKGDLKKFQQAWGKDYKSFDEAMPPKVAHFSQYPGPWLDWHRFNDGFYADFLREYFQTIQSQDPLKRPVVAKNTQCSLEMQAVARNRNLDHELVANATRDLSQGWYGFDQYGHGDRNNYEMNYFYNCIRPENPEPGKRYGGFSGENNNHAGPGWQFAQTYYRIIPNGLRGGEFFCMGSIGAKGDWKTFSFIYPDGTLHDRFFYAARFANMVHRTERLWSGSTPADGTPKLALLMPKREVYLAQNTGVSWWDYSTNSRLNVYSRLRDAGYWVDVIPYGKLKATYLANYQGLFLVNAEHLSDTETREIADYVRNGGTLFADMMAGKYDQHHIETNGLEKVLGLTFKGVYTGKEVSPDDLWYNTPYGNVIRGDGKILAELNTAKIINERDVFDNAKAAWITCNDFGKGKAFWFNTRLGALRPESADNLVLAQWFAQRLQTAGLKPGYSSNLPDQTEFRLEQPMVDTKGNCIYAITGTTYRPVPPSAVTVTLPKGQTISSAWWGSAESTWVTPVSYKLNDNGTATFQMPKIQSAGMLYLLPNYAPIVGIRIEDAKRFEQHDEHTATVEPEETFTVKVQAVNPTAHVIPPSSLSLKAISSWKVSPAQNVPALQPGETREYTFKVTVAKTFKGMHPHLACPLVATLTHAGKRTAVANAIVTMNLSAKNFDHLLTENQSWGNVKYNFSIKTGATYEWELPKGGVFQDPSTKGNGRHGNALTQGRDWWTNVAYVRAPIINIIFDLKKPYAVTMVKVNYLDGKFPKAMNVLVSSDGKTFTQIAQQGKLTWEKKWTTVHVKQTPARFVKVQLIYPKQPGGWIDDVAIFGRTLD